MSVVHRVRLPVGASSLKISGSPAESYGLVDGQWTEVPPDSPLSQFIDRGAIDPARIAEIFATDFKAVSGGEKRFAAAGSEELDGVATTTGARRVVVWLVSENEAMLVPTHDSDPAARDQVDLGLVSVDSATARAHHHAAGLTVSPCT